LRDKIAIFMVSRMNIKIVHILARNKLSSTRITVLILTLE